MRRIVVLSVLLLVLSFATMCTGADPPPAPTTSVAELRGQIDAYLAGPTMADVRAVLVVAGDRTVVEEYYGTTADEYRDVFSVTKSVLSTLVGIAIDEGLMELDDPLGQLLPGYAGAMTPAVAATTLEELLTMTGGFRNTLNPSSGADVFEQPDWVAACLGAASRPPGERFAYSDPGTHLVAAALAAATGRSVLEYAREKLFDALGVDTDATGFAWSADPQGIHAGAGGLTLRPRDMAALGSLYLHGGTVGDARVLSRDWALDATSMHLPTRGPADGYGYLWWVGEADGSAAYMAIGYGGQLLEVVPDRDLVVAVSTHVEQHATVDATQLIHLVDRIIAPAF